MRWLETISKWLFFFIQICVSACRQKYLNYAHSAVAFPVFFTLQPEIGRALLPILIKHTRRDELRRFPLPLPLPLLFWMYLPYLTLHYSPSREVDTKVGIQERKSGTVCRTNQYRQRHIPTYLGTYMYLFGLQRMLKEVGTGTSIPTLPTLGTLPTTSQ